ncbi:MAG: hypothetical protein BGO87_05310 [Flavobacteriia bacterium 40-80]|nr:MAG: hypothetical protein BGO87_05310 [Flavobacteriia bacterium 40-80]
MADNTDIEIYNYYFMKQLTLILFTFLLNIHLLTAQNQANNWYFGVTAGLTFNTTPPSALTDGVVNTAEGSATMSDASGNLLFYTDGITVWNRNHQIMPNGTGLLGDPSAAQSAIIVPKPGSQTNYYVITVPVTSSNGMCYSEVDMSLNGGLGGILTTNKNTLMFTPSSEKVTAVRHANGLYYWVIGRKNGATDSKVYIAFLIDCNGVNTSSPVESNVGITNAENWGYLVASPDGTKLASASSGSGIELTSFDNQTGVVSNTIDLGSLSYSGTTGGNYGVSFSPNSNVLYAASITNWALVQWDLTAANIPASKIYIGDLQGNGASRPSYRGGALQLGPDGKLYTTQTGTTYLGVVNNPNVVGAGCNLQIDAVSLNGRTCRLGLPPFIQSYFSTHSIDYANHCEGEQTQFTLLGANYLDSVRWNFNDPSSGSNTSNLLNPVHTFSSAGTYNVQLIRYLDCISDTIYRMVTIHAPATTQQTITLCANGTFELPDGQVVSDPGTYQSTITSVLTGCDSIVTTVLVAPQTNFSAGNDQFICKGNTAQLQAGQALNYSWQPAASLNNPSIANPVATPDTTTTYIVSSQVQLSNNLIVNGDFESGNTLFSSGYNYSQPNPLNGPGHYTVNTSVTNGWWPNCGDHTTGTGRMLIADGANNSNGVSQGASIWCQTIQVMPNTDYAFSTWLTNVNASGSTSQLGFFINGTQIGQTQNTPMGACTWNQFYVIWNSGSQTSANVCISEMSGAQPGNDFALDDISFYQICTITDTVTVHVSDIELEIAQQQNVDCFGNSTGAVTIAATGGIEPYSYSWNSGQATASLSQLPQGTYVLTVTDDANCVKDISVTVSEPAPLIVSAVANNIIECQVTNTGNATVNISGGTPGYTVLWDNQESTVTATQLSPGNHQVVVTDANNCTNTANVVIQYKEPPSLNISTQDECLGQTSSFSSQATISAPEVISSYQWTITHQGTQAVVNSTDANTSLILDKTGAYTASLTVMSSNGCTVNKVIPFTIFPNPAVQMEYATECFQVVEFNAVATHADHLQMQYEWDIYNDQIIDYNVPSFSQYFESAQPFVLRLKVADTRGCFTELTETISILEGKADIEFPNVISMKSLVGNNQFDLEKVMPNFNVCINYTLRILNRWGNVVFEVKNNTSDPDLNCSHCFKGKTNKGEELTPGVYFFELTGDYDIKKQGFITIVNEQ